MQDVTTRIGGVPEHFNLPWERAINLARENDRPVSWTEFPGGSGAMARALESREIDVAVMLTASTLKAISGGLAARIVGTHVPSPLRWGIHVAAGSDIVTEAQIRGRSVAISRQGSGSHLVPYVDALIRGWSPADLEFVEIGDLTGAREALASGAAEVFFWEQFMTQPLVDAGEFRRVGVRLPPWPSFLIVAHEEWLAESPDVTSFLAAVDHQGQRLALDETTPELIADRFHMSESQATDWISLTDWRTLPSVPQQALESASRYLDEALGVKIAATETLVAAGCELT